MVTQADITDFSGQKEVEVSSKPQIKQFKKGDIFIWYLQSIMDKPLNEWVDNWMGWISFGNKVFTFVAVWDKNVDHKSDDWTGTWESVKNEIVAWEEYNFFTNYTKKNFLNVNGGKLSVLPLGAIVKLENMGKKKSENSSFSYKDISIIAKKDSNDKYVIHPDYKEVDDFSWQEEISVEDIPF